MLFPELYKTMVNKVTYVGFRGQSPKSYHLDPPLRRIWLRAVQTC